VIYYQHGYIDPSIAIPTALGVLVGAQAGTRLGTRTRSSQLKTIFQVLLLAFALEMLYKGISGIL
jgi:uncharacterized membrane protein YfcA